MHLDQNIYNTLGFSLQSVNTSDIYKKDKVFWLPLSYRLLLYIVPNSQNVFIFPLKSHHFDPLSSAEGFIDLSLWQMVFRSAVGSQLDGLLRNRLVGLVQLIELFEQ